MSPRFFVSDVVTSDAPSDELDGYAVKWRINPHMQPGRTSLDLALSQHDGLVRALRAAGAEVGYWPFIRGCHDCVFVKDTALLLDGPSGPRALLSAFRHPERRCEQARRRAGLISHGFRIYTTGCLIEGGDLIRLGNTMLLGHGFRTDLAAADVVRDVARMEVLPLELVDERLYHLDTALAALSDGTVLACRDAFSPGSFAALGAHPAVRELIEVPLEAALAFGLNLVEVNDRVILATGAPAVEAVLAACGLTPVPIPLDQFLLAGGSAACLTARIHVLGGATQASLAA
jgi:N-dimethylarginine dimethylaminohydrolase